MLRSPTDQDLWLLEEGRHSRLPELTGAVPLEDGGVAFGVWAPTATAVGVVGDWQGWAEPGAPLAHVGGGIWQGVDPGASIGDRYKFRIVGADGHARLKADPMARHAEEPSGTASVVWASRHSWRDEEWMGRRVVTRMPDAPLSIYELHLGSWRPGLPAPLYRSIADPLIEHVTALGFTHVEFLPVMEHPFGGSWGYQTTGYFAPTCRYGSPDDLRFLIDRLHEAGIGVIVDWVPSHFPADEHALARFDGTACYEHPDPRRGYHPDWHSLIFDYGRGPVRSFLISSAAWWADQFHVDGIRVDAVASMLYLDYSRRPGEWLPNDFGGNENLEAIQFLRALTETLDHEHPDVAVFAEESTAWPGVTGDRGTGGLGFDWKWDMGWMHDTLEYASRDAVHRGWHHDDLTRRALWAGSERYCLPLSHDEVVHGKGSLLGRIPGDDWQRLATLRLLLGTQWCTPGKKLVFMGAELGQPTEWSHESFLPWDLADDDAHAGIGAWLARCNELYRREPSLHATDHQPEDFTWTVGDDKANSVFVWTRRAAGADPIVVVANWSPTVHEHYRFGVPVAGPWRELATSDDPAYGGSGITNADLVATDEPAHGQPASLVVRVPPLAISILGAST